MNSESTITNVTPNPIRNRGGAPAHDQLIILASSDDPRRPSSRHVLDDIDVVRFGRSLTRGQREVRRHLDGGQRVLTLKLPDPRVSADHGSIRRVETGWLLEDPRSRNGVVVNGALTRRTMLGDGALLEFGHTFLLLHGGSLEEGAPLDVDEAGLRAPLPTLATLDGQLADRFTALARLAPQANVAVLLLGETGTGKEVVARALHELSGRKGEFVGINCGAIPATLLEAQLFGHRRGAFTGAVVDRPGYVRSADGGTLLLDEIGELPLAGQAALLRVIADRSVLPVGEDRAVPVDVRICAATLRDLSALVELDTFRRDLYARLIGFKLRLPPLRERRADFGLLLRARLAEISGGGSVTFTPAALRQLFRYDWPLNIRELDTVLQRAVGLSPDGVIDLPHLELQQSIVPPRLLMPTMPQPALAEGAAAADASTPPAQDAEPRRPPPFTPTERPTPQGPQAASSEELLLRTRLIEALTEHHGNVKRTAKALGTRRMQVYRWVERFELDLDSFRR